MNALRWILGSIAVAFGGGFVFLVILSNAFRKSFGASPNGALLLVLPLAALGVLLAALLFPGCKPLLHVAAVAAVGLVGFCLWQMVAESATVLWLALLYLAAWFTFYWLAGWRAGAAP
jgi:hypothetical protein